MEKEPNRLKEPFDLYPIIYRLARTALDFKFERTFDGEENILDEPAIYAANHILLADSILLSTTYSDITGKSIRFAVKDGYLKGTGVDDKGKFGKTAQFVMRHSLQVPVNREGGDVQAQRDFEQGVKRTLERGDSFAIHPEGTRSQDGKLHKFKSGVARLAIANKVPIVPVGIVYSELKDSKKQGVKLTFGEPLMPEAYTHLPYTAIPGIKYKSEHAAQIIENRVAKLTGMEQSERFAILRKLRHQTAQE